LAKESEAKYYEQVQAVGDAGRVVKEEGFIVKM